VRSLLRHGSEMMVRRRVNGADSGRWITRHVSASKKRIFFSPLTTVASDGDVESELKSVGSEVHNLRASTGAFNDTSAVFVILVDRVADLTRDEEEEEDDACVRFTVDDASYSIKSLHVSGATAEEWHRALLYLAAARNGAKTAFSSPVRASAAPAPATTPTASPSPMLPSGAALLKTPTTTPDVNRSPTRAAWRPVVDPLTGRQYWHDEESMQSVWVLPAEAVDGAIDFADDWVEHVHPESKRLFWFSPSLKKSVWVKPRLATREERALSPPRPARVSDWVERLDPDTGRVFQFSPSLQKCVYFHLFSLSYLIVIFLSLARTCVRTHAARASRSSHIHNNNNLTFVPFAIQVGMGFEQRS